MSKCHYVWNIYFQILSNPRGSSRHRHRQLPEIHSCWRHLFWRHHLTPILFFTRNNDDAVEQCQHSGKYYHKIYYLILKLFTSHFQMKYFDATILLQVSLIIFSISIISSSNPQRPHYNLSTSSSRGLCMKGEAKSICLPPDYVKVSNFQ